MLPRHIWKVWRRLRRRLIARVPSLAAVGRPQSRLGIDIGSTQIKIVDAFAHEDQVFVERILCTDTPHAAIAGYVVRDVDGVAAAIRKALAASGSTGRAVVASVPAPVAVIKRVNLSLGDADRIDAVIQGEVENLASVGSDSLCVDYQVQERPDEDGLEALVAAARTEVVQGYVDAVERAGLICEAVDIDSLALTNMFETSCRLDASRTAALIHVGARFSVVIIHSHGRPVLAGDVAAGTTCRENWVDHAAEEIDRALRFYWPASAGDRIDEILLSGGAAWEGTFVDALSHRTGFPVRLADPFSRMRRRFERTTRADSFCVAQFGVATGLALRALEYP